MMGCGFALGEAGYNVGRNAALLAGLDHHIPATTVNRFCASSLQTLRMAFHAIKAGEGDQYIAAGVEAVSRFPQYPPVDPHPQPRRLRGRAVRRLHPDGADRRERRASAAASRARRRTSGPSSRRTARSRRATAGTSTPRSSPVGDVTRDDGPRPGTTLEKLAELKPVFDPEHGTVTAGNACPLNDGAAAVLVMSAEKAAALGLKPRARIVASSVAAIRPEIMGLGPIPAVKAVLEQAGMTIDDIDIVELNEAFAAQVVPVPRRARDRRREAEPVRRRDRARAPVRDDRRADHDDAAQRPRRDRRHARPGDHVRGRRDGPGDDRGAIELNRILFVCMGNICRSPTAEGVMRGLVREAGLENEFEIDSAGHRLLARRRPARPPRHRGRRRRAA